MVINANAVLAKSTKNVNFSNLDIGEKGRWKKNKQIIYGGLSINTF